MPAGRDGHQLGMKGSDLDEADRIFAAGFFRPKF
jgi:hypothetical protein